MVKMENPAAGEARGASEIDQLGGEVGSEDSFTAEWKQALSLIEMGREIVARINAGDKARGRADNMYLSAGLQLIEARKLAPCFSTFLAGNCVGVSRSRAYELIAIAEGKGDDVREKNRTRDRRRRAKTTRPAQPRSHHSAQTEPQDSPVREFVREPRTDDLTAKIKPQRALAEFKVAVDIWFSKMDGAAKLAALAYVVERADAK